jgi:hypothetical protein
MLKLTVADASLAEYRLTGTETSPNEIVAELIGLGAIGFIYLVNTPTARILRPETR